MNIKQITCRSCNGVGRRTIWKTVSMDEKTGIGTAVSEEVVCEECNGKRYLEYAQFSVEEAKAILKHCGLNTES